MVRREPIHQTRPKTADSADSDSLLGDQVLRDLQEGLLHVHAVDCARLNERHAQLVREGLRKGERNGNADEIRSERIRGMGNGAHLGFLCGHYFVRLVDFISNQKLASILRRVSIDFHEPIVDVVE